jgi:hypothetical protein
MRGREDWDNGCAALKSCISRSLLLASNNQWRTVAFPAISCGIYGFDNAKAAATITVAVAEFFLSVVSTVKEVTFLFLYDQADLIYHAFLHAARQANVPLVEQGASSDPSPAPLSLPRSPPIPCNAGAGAGLFTPYCYAKGTLRANDAKAFKAGGVLLYRTRTSGSGSGKRGSFSLNMNNFFTCTLSSTF